MSALITLRDAAPLLACRDPRTARRRLADLGVRVVVLRGRVLVSSDAIDDALRAHARPLDPAAPTRPGGVVLAPGQRLWDTDTARAAATEEGNT